MAVAEPLRLTSLSHGAGCACKLGPSQLHEVLELLGPSVPTDDVVVSEASGDDAAVYRLSDGTGAIVTLDFFTPLVDDPFDWGRIAAANALSDVYAMGGRPALALNVAGWPVDVLPLEMLADVLRGGRADRRPRPASRWWAATRSPRRRSRCTGWSRSGSRTSTR